MSWFSEWDDLVHGTLVFSVAIPFLIALALSFVAPPKLWWVVVAMAAVPVLYWLFRIPNLPPKSSDDIAAGGLLAGLALILLERLIPPLGFWPVRLILRGGAFFAICWTAYPAWLAEDETVSKLLVCAGFGASVALGSVILEQLSRGIKDGGRPLLTPAALIPPVAALAVLLQTGGSMRYAQVAGAIATGLCALCLALLLRRNTRREAGLHQSGTVAICTIVALVLGWSGWLYSEIRYMMAALLLLAPLAAAIVNLLPLPRKHPFLTMLWDAVAAAAVAVPIAVIAAREYAEAMAEFEGY